MLAKGDVAGSMEGFAESAAATTLGPVEPLKAAISRLFPTLDWHLSSARLPDGSAGSSWFGYQGPPEFHLMVEPSGEVRVVNMSHCERTEVEQVARALGLVALDLQSTEVFGG
jgi:hypothetical protein